MVRLGAGKNVERYPEIARRIVAEGHTIGNHTYSHPFPYFRRTSFIAAEIDRAQDVITRVTGQRPRIFRPPFGARWLEMCPVLRERGLPLINWSDTGYDWKQVVDIAGESLKHLRPGAIILLHDGTRIQPPQNMDQSPRSPPCRPSSMAHAELVSGLSPSSSLYRRCEETSTSYRLAGLRPGVGSRFILS